jgi:hypothetical protein
MSEHTTTTDDAQADDQTYETITFVEATDADTQSLLFGRHEQPTEAREPEELSDGTIAYVRRVYEPVSAVSLPRAMAAEPAQQWVDANRDHPGLEGYDWDAHERRGLLATIVETRASYNRLVSGTIDQLEAVPNVSVEADQAVGQIQETLLDALDDSPPTVVDRTGEVDDAA